MQIYKNKEEILIYTEESLREELIAKLEKEQKEYLDGLKEKGVDEVIKKSMKLMQDKRF